MSAAYAGIIINISHEKVDRAFTYRVPERLANILRPGVCVRVPFGRGNNIRFGYCVALYASREDLPKDAVAEDKMKEILGIEQENLPAEAVMVQLAAWMKHTYGATMIQALKTVLPVSKKEKGQVKKTLRLNMKEEEARACLLACERKNFKAKARLLTEMLRYPEGTFPYELMTKKLSVSAQTVNSLRNAGVISVLTDTVYRNPTFGKAAEKKNVTLSVEQRHIVDAVMQDFTEGKRGVSLLHGITGSGKTEVYIEIIKEVVQRGCQAIVLIPEIALTYQTLMRFYEHFNERVSVMNSSLSKGERFDQFERARKGEIDVIIGPRSALFTPFPKLGLIIIDEEHESSYKSETAPKYHAREAAKALSKIVPGGASIVLGSATPSVDSYARALAGEYALYTLTTRLTGGSLAEVTIADLREELRAGNRSIFSRALFEKLTQCLERKEQAMLFLNRRGIAGFVSCRACGYVFECPHCDVALSAHAGNRLLCHYCGYEARATRECPSCKSKYVSAFRAGTEQVEKEVLKIFPKARVLRMDADTTRTKGSYEEILTAFKEGEADILVGTQMIVKGHDFPNVTVMGILAADMSLYAADYMAAERTFELLTQAAGRAGRGTRKGEVVIQTYRPDHYSIQAAAAQDYLQFYQEEIAYRTALLYPPGAHMLSVQFLTRDEAYGVEAANKFRALLERSDGDGCVFIGPALAAIGRINDVYRYVLYIKHKDAESLIRLKDVLEAHLETPAGEAAKRRIQVQFDLDPVRGY